MTSPQFDNSQYSVGWIAALPHERAAAEVMLDDEHAPPRCKHENDNNIYTLGSITGPNGKHNVVIASLPSGRYGITPAGTAATQMLSSFPAIKFGLMVGIGGGVPSGDNDIRLGDVVVSQPDGSFGGVRQYDCGKVTTLGFEERGALNSSPRVLLNAMAALQSEHEKKGSAIPSILESVYGKYPLMAKPRSGPGYIYQGASNDRLFRPEYLHQNNKKDCSDCDKTNEVVRSERSDEDPYIHYGIIASGNVVVKDAHIRDLIAGTCLCFETEAAGLMNDFPCLVIRGICDYCDSHKNDKWQRYAAVTAAAYAKELLRITDVVDVNGTPEARKVMHELQKVNQGLQKVNQNVVQIQTEVKEGFGDLRAARESTDILEWLTPMDYDLQQSDFLSKRQKGTGEWLLQSDEFQNWIKQTEHILFCPGIPGAGKTIISSIVVDHLIETFGNDTDVGIAYIYCSYQPHQEQRPEDLLASILKRLAQKKSEMLSELKIFYDHHKVNGSRPSFEDYTKFLQSCVRLFSKVFIVIDALDEYHASDNATWKRILVLKELTVRGGARINLFATSRSISEVTSEFKGCSWKEIRAQDGDIQTYLNERIPQFRAALQFAERPELRDTIRADLIEAADGMFLVAKMLVDSLVNLPTLGHIIESMKDLPRGESGLITMYKKAMERIEGQDGECRRIAKQVLSWVAYAKRALSTTEVQHAVAVHARQKRLDKDFLPEIKVLDSLCAGLITVDKNSDIIRLVHYTTQEYLESSRSLPTAHGDIATTCVTYLSFDAFAGGACGNTDELKQRMQSNPLYGYATHHWGYHAREAAIDAAKLMPFLRDKEKVRAAGQAMLASTPRNETMIVPKRSSKPTGIHLAAYFGLKEAMTIILRDAANAHLDDQPTPLAFASVNGHVSVVRLLLSHGAHPDSKKDDKSFSPRTPLWLAAVNGHVKVVELLIAKGADPNIQDDEGRAPLLQAAARGHEEVVKLLIANGVDPDTKSGGKSYAGCTPLSFAAATNHQAILHILLDTERVDVNSLDSSGWTPLFYAAEKGHETTMKLLLENGAHPDLTDLSKRTPLSITAEGGHQAVVRLLLADSRVDPHVADDCGRTPLSYAVWSGDESSVEQLIQRGVNLNCADIDGRTALCLAAGTGHEGIVKTLLGKDGVLPDPKDKGGRTPLCLAAKQGYAGVVKLLLNTGKVNVDHKDSTDCTPLLLATEKAQNAVVELLVLSGANPELADKDGRTPILCAAENGNQPAVRMLLDLGVSFSAKDKEQRNLLWWAAEKGYESIVRELLESGAEEVRDSKFSQTPLSCAAERGHSTVVKILIASGSDPDSGDKDGRTPLSWAVECKHKSVVEILLANDKVNPDAGDRSGRTPLSYAAWTGDLVFIRLLLQQETVNINSADKSGRTPLSFAAEKGHLPAVKLLLARGAYLDFSENENSTPIVLAKKCNHQAIVDLFLDRLAIIRDIPYRPRTSLLWAVETGYEVLVKFLLENGANVNSLDWDESTPLFRVKSVPIAKLLIEFGADVNHQDRYYRWTPVMKAAIRADAPVVEFLLQNGAEVDAVNRENRTAMVLAVQRGYEGVVEVLLKHGADPKFVKDWTSRFPGVTAESVDATDSAAGCSGGSRSLLARLIRR